MRSTLATVRSLRVLLPALAVALVASFLAVGSLHRARADDVPLSQGRPVTSSSVEGGNWVAANAVDGNDRTRWSSASGDGQWLTVDLGVPASVTRVVLKWDAAYAKAFQVQVSGDGSTWTTVYTTTAGTGGTQTLGVTGTGRYVRMLGTTRATRYGFSLWEFQVYGTPAGGGAPATGVAPAPATSAVAPSGGYVDADHPVTGATPSMANPPHAYFHEFQTDCDATRTLPDDPIVYPDRPGASHPHTFLGNTTTTAATTVASLRAGTSSCKVAGDLSGYWMPTLYNGDKVVMPVGPQVIYYKTNLVDYTSVRPFPTGLRFVVGSPSATADDFKNGPGYVAGWECGDSYHNIDFPATCPAGSRLNIRFQAPSCWDGLHLDSPDHKSHMAYPVDGRCTKDHPVALPMIEFKMAFPVSGDMSRVRLSSGRAFSFHYDFFNAWDPATLAALVEHCIVGGLQCDARGYDQTQPDKGAALTTKYTLS